MADTPLDFRELQQHCQELEQFYAKRNENNDKIDQMYYLKWNAPSKGDGTQANMKITINTQPRNAADGVRQLLTATTPIFSVPSEKNNSNDEIGDKLERAANTMWGMAGRQRGKTLEHDAAGLGVRRDEVHIGVALTADLLENATGSGASNLARLGRLAKLTPVFFEIYDPQTGYPEYDSYGLKGYFRKVLVKSGVVLDAWGENAINAGLNPADRWADVTLCEWMDYANRVVWIEGKQTPIYNGEHGLGVLPVVCKILNGSPTTGKTSDEQVQPFLYGIMQSGLWQSANLYATIADTNALAIASNPTFIQNLEDPENAPQVDYSVPGGVLRLRRGESHQPMAKNAIDPAIMTQAARVDAAMEKASVYEVALGKPLGDGSTPYSTIALLNQAGRLPLTSIQMGLQYAFADAMQVGFAMLKAAGHKAKINGERGVVEIDASEIPDDVVFDCRVDVSLPQDDRQNVVIAAEMVKSGLADKERAREIIGIGQSSDMERRIIKDQLMQLKVGQLLKTVQLQIEAQAKAQQMQMQPPPQQPEQPGQQVGMGLPALPMTEPTVPNGAPEQFGPAPEAMMQGGGM